MNSEKDLELETIVDLRNSVEILLLLVKSIEEKVEAMSSKIVCLWDKLDCLTKITPEEIVKMNLPLSYNYPINSSVDVAIHYPINSSVDLTIDGVHYPRSYYL